MNIPLVSVIMPAYNSTEYIGKAIESVLAQNIPLELIIINDCSTDNLDEIISKYIYLDNIVYIKNEYNIGVAKSRNLGIKYAKGKYISYLDADDWWNKDKLQKQLQLMEVHNYFFCYTARQLVLPDGTLTNRILNVSKDVNYKRLLRHNIISCSSVILLKCIAEEIPMVHDSYHEDYINWLMITKKYGSVHGIDEPLVFYRLSDNGKSRNKLKSARMTFGVYRLIGINRIQASYFLASHLIHGLFKYYFN